MDEMRINLSAKFMKSIVTKILRKVIRKKFGYDIDIQINDLVIVSSEGKVRIHADVDGETTNEEFAKIVKSITKDES